MVSVVFPATYTYLQCLRLQNIGFQLSNDVLHVRIGWLEKFLVKFEILKKWRFSHFSREFDANLWLWFGDKIRHFGRFFDFPAKRRLFPATWDPNIFGSFHSRLDLRNALPSLFFWPVVTFLWLLGQKGWFCPNPEKTDLVL